MNHRDTIYADYQATTPVDPRVLEKNGALAGAVNHSVTRTPATMLWAGKPAKPFARRPNQ